MSGGESDKLDELTATSGLRRCPKRAHAPLGAIVHQDHGDPHRQVIQDHGCMATPIMLQDDARSDRGVGCAQRHPGSASGCPVTGSPES